MGTESIVLYKLIVLYMLDRVNFTLTNSQISDFTLFHFISAFLSQKGCSRIQAFSPAGPPYELPVKR